MRSVLLPLALVPLASLAQAQSWAPDGTLSASPGSTNPHSFGQRGIALDSAGRTCLVPHLSDSTVASLAGAAYVFRRAGSVWSLQQKLVVAGSGTFDTYGQGFALSGDGNLAALGSSDVGQKLAGSVSVFEFDGTTWNETAAVVPDDLREYMEFGANLALDEAGERLFVAAAEEQTFGPGAVYVFRKEGQAWVQEARLRSDRAPADASFGSVLAVTSSGRRIVVACSPMSDARSLFVFDRIGDAWVETAELEAPRRWPLNLVTISADGGVIAAETPAHPPFVRNSVHVFREVDGAWEVPDRIFSPVAAPTNGFGRPALGPAGDQLVCGSAVGGATAYVYRWLGGEWVLESVLFGRGPTAFSRGGRTLATHLVGGTVNVFTQAPAGGSCYGTSCPCGNDGGLFHGCDDRDALGGVSLAARAQDTVARTAELVGTAFPADREPSVLALRSRVPTAPTPFGDGRLCLGAPVVRLAAGAARDGIAVLPIEHGPLSGAFDYQLWYRNAPAAFCDPAPFNTSSAVRLVWP